MNVHQSESSNLPILSTAVVAWVEGELGGLGDGLAQWQSGVYAVVDCVFSAQAKYESMVLPMLLERLPSRPGLVDEPELTFSAFIADIESFGDEPWDAYGNQVLNLQVLAGRRKVEVCHEIARFFVQRGLETMGDLRALGEEELLELVLGPLQQSIRGMGPALARYLTMLLGVESQVKFDTMLQRFFEQLCGQVGWSGAPITMEQAEDVMREAASQLGTTPARLDHAIWRFMSQGGVVRLSPAESERGLEFEFGEDGDSTQADASSLHRLATRRSFWSRFHKVDYATLNSRQKESYNFHKLAAELAGFGFTCMQLADDWEGADFLAVHYLGDSVLKVQLKARLTIMKKYRGKDLWIGFPHGGDWYLIEHDRLVQIVGQCTNFLETASWAGGSYSTARPSKVLLERLEDFRITSGASN